MSGIPEATAIILTNEEHSEFEGLASSTKTEHRVEVTGALRGEATCGSRRDRQAGFQAEIHRRDQQTHFEGVGRPAARRLRPLDWPADRQSAGRRRRSARLALLEGAEDRSFRAQILVREQ